VKNGQNFSTVFSLKNKLFNTMCGIYGTTIRYKKQEVETKLNRISFRGPDKMGVSQLESDDNLVTLGHNRLAIIDLDPRSNQPFAYNENIHIVFNGEIYNYLDLKKSLGSKGYSFNTTSDTEVMCAAYMEYGEKCVDYFNGMFAFVIYDKKKQLLFGARDRMGKKPFYYYINGRDFEFASQISAIQLFNKNLSISQKSINNYLSWGTIPDPDTIFNEVKKLKAGYSFVYDLNSGSYNQKPYWDLDYKGTNLYKGSYEEAKDELESILSDAVKIRLFADVPVGIFLSGGVDSSLVAAMATKATNEKVKTFSVKFDTKGFDESAYAQKVALHLQTDHHVIECNYNEGIDLISNLCEFYDEPFADSSAVPSLLLSKHTKKHVTVALSGDGGDESFLGYHRYNWMKYVQKAYDLPDFARNILVNGLNIIPYYKSKVIANVLNNKNINDAYLGMMVNTKNHLLVNTPDLSDLEERKYLYHENKNIYERISDFDLKTYLNWDINTKVDRASMAFSLETRAPLLDYRVVEFSRSIPTDFKFSKNNQKRILKDILYKHVPKEFFDRPKSGFTMPFKVWFRNELKDYVLSELSDEGLKTIPGIKIPEVKATIQEHMDGTANKYPTIWALLVLKQWLSKNAAGLEIK
jgi:asparagine synthase (glutamine-hydrolysing)